jgi:nicotinate dehydrogenase subunit A
MSKITKLQVNGTVHTIDADESESLLSVLRDQLDLTGSKYGCGEGQCGACTVLVDSRSRRSCITKIGSIADKKITTIEGLAAGDRLHPVQQAFLDEQAMQCAYCASGMIMSAMALLNKTAQPSRREIIDFMDGNICRCGTYPRIVAAIERASRNMPAATKEARS